MTLQARAKQFLSQPVPKEIQYVPGSVAEIFIQNYANGGTFDDELLELGELSSMTIDEALESHSTADAQAYFKECQSILNAILKEVGAN